MNVQYLLFGSAIAIPFTEDYTPAHITKLPIIVIKSAIVNKSFLLSLFKNIPPTNIKIRPI